VRQKQAAIVAASGSLIHMQVAPSPSFINALSLLKATNGV